MKNCNGAVSSSALSSWISTVLKWGHDVCLCLYVCGSCVRIQHRCWTFKTRLVLGPNCEASRMRQLGFAIRSSIKQVLCLIHLSSGDYHKSNWKQYTQQQVSTYITLMLLHYYVQPKPRVQPGRVLFEMYGTLLHRAQFQFPTSSAVNLKNSSERERDNNMWQKHRQRTDRHLPSSIDTQ